MFASLLFSILLLQANLRVIANVIYSPLILFYSLYSFNFIGCSLIPFYSNIVYFFNQKKKKPSIIFYFDIRNLEHVTWTLVWFGRSCMCFNNCLISFKKILTFKNDKKNLLPKCVYIYIYIFILDALARLLIIDFIVLSQQQKILKSKFYFYLLEIYRIQSFFSIYIRHCHFKFNAFSKN